MATTKDERSLGEMFAAIQTRLSPTRAIADVKDSLTDATVGRLKRLAEGLARAAAF